MPDEVVVLKNLLRLHRKRYFNLVLAVGGLNPKGLLLSSFWSPLLVEVQSELEQAEEQAIHQGVLEYEEVEGNA